MKKKLIVLSSSVLGFAPFLALAQGSTTDPCAASTSGTIQDILCKFSSILDAVVPVLIALGVVYFIYGVVTYMIGSDEEAKKAGRDRIIFGVIGLFVIVTVWGLVSVLSNTFDIGTTFTPSTTGN